MSEKSTPDQIAEGPAPWDLFVRLFHWSLVTGILLNALILDDEGAAHEWIGYTVLGLLGLRVIWGFVGPAKARFSSFPLSFRAAGVHIQEMLHGIARPHGSHNPLGALMVYNLMLSVFLTGLTGYLMTTDAFWGSGMMEEMHEFLSNWILFSAVIHVAGVLFESLRSGHNLLAPMLGRRG